MARKKYQQKKENREKREKEAQNSSGKTLQELYDELDNMSLQERQTRISIIDKQLEVMARETFNSMTDVDEEELTEQEMKEKADKVADILKNASKLKKEKRTLEESPKVKDKLEKIAKIQERAIEVKSEAMVKLFDLKKELLSKIEEAERKQDEINFEIQKAEDSLNILTGDAFEVSRQAIINEMQKLQAEKAKFNLEELREEYDNCSNELEMYEEGRSEQDKIINRCKLPWENLLSGLKWHEIAIMSNEKLIELAKKDETIGKDEEHSDKEAGDNTQGTGEPNNPENEEDKNIKTQEQKPAEQQKGNGETHNSNQILNNTEAQVHNEGEQEQGEQENSGEQEQAEQENSGEQGIDNTKKNIFAIIGEFFDKRGLEKVKRTNAYKIAYRKNHNGQLPNGLQVFLAETPILRNMFAKYIDNPLDTEKEKRAIRKVERKVRATVFENSEEYRDPNMQEITSDNTNTIVGYGKEETERKIQLFDLKRLDKVAKEKINGTHMEGQKDKSIGFSAPSTIKEKRSKFMAEQRDGVEPKAYENGRLNMDVLFNAAKSNLDRRSTIGQHTGNNGREEK